MREENYFITALNLMEHPMKNEKERTRKEYYSSILYFLKEYELNEIQKSKMLDYKNFLLGNEIENKLLDEKRFLSNLITCKFRPWKNKYKYYILYDLALILQDDQLLNHVGLKISHILSKRKKIKFEQALELICRKNSEEDYEALPYGNQILLQYFKNKEFLSTKERRYMVTANVSSGKSSFINAITGKRLTATFQGICTNKISYIYNKPFEDRKVDIKDEAYVRQELSEFLKEKKDYTHISTAFNLTTDYKERICLIDTPGVNSSIDKNHGQISYKALKEEDYDKLIYIFNANTLGTDDEQRHLSWVSNNVDKEKLIFILNKVDSFNEEDDMDESIAALKLDLKKLGFENPEIYPFSSQFALWYKTDKNGEELSKLSQLKYESLKELFLNDYLDFTDYYRDLVDNKIEVNQSIRRKAGIEGMEKLILGGI